MKSKRTQADRTAATREALVAAARALFTERGYAEVSADEIARGAGVTRGALYYQFDGTQGLFLAVFEQIEDEIVARLGAELAVAEGDPIEVLKAGVDAWLAAGEDPVVHQLALVEAPSVLGWEVWREVGLRTSLGLVEFALTGAIEAGALQEQPVRPLAHVLVGALEEAALFVAHSPDPDAAREQVRTALHALVDGLTVAERGDGQLSQ